MIGRATQVVDCRESMGLAKGGGLAQRGTHSEATKPDVIAIAISPGRRHITKPVCEMTYGLRREGIQTSVLVLEAGTGLPDSFPQASRGYGPTFGLNERELEQVARHKIGVLHLGNVRSHVISKAKEVLAQVEIPAVVVAQCPIDMEDFAKEGIKTRTVKPAYQKTETKGEVVDIVHAVANHGNERISQSLLINMGGITLGTALSTQPVATQQLFSALYGMGSEVGLMLPYSRLHESEADHLGLIFMAMAGYDPNSAIAFMERLRTSNKKASPPAFLSTHPADATRINAMKQVIPEAMQYYRKKQ